MKCSSIDYIAVPPEDQSRFAYNFSEFESIPTKTDYTVIGIGSHPDVYNLYDRIAMLYFELPNCLVHTDPCNLGHYSKVINHGDRFLKLLTNCPFSVEYFNKKYNYDKFQFAFAPFNEKYIPHPEPKLYDVFYTGHFPCPISHAIPIITKFSHCIVSRSWGTHVGASYKEKLKLNAQSKASIVHGLLLWPDQYKNAIEQFQGHRAFDLVHEHGIVPQIKTRTFEAAVSKSIILSLHDPWNMIESYFEPNEDFLYWYNLDDLEEKIRHISEHYEDYLPMVESAYNKVVNNWTTQHFFDTYLKNL